MSVLHSFSTNASVSLSCVRRRRLAASGSAPPHLPTPCTSRPHRSACTQTRGKAHQDRLQLLYQLHRRRVRLHLLHDKLHEAPLLLPEELLHLLRRPRAEDLRQPVALAVECGPADGEREDLLPARRDGLYELLQALLLLLLLRPGVGRRRVGAGGVGGVAPQGAWVADSLSGHP